MVDYGLITFPFKRLMIYFQVNGFECCSFLHFYAYRRRSFFILHLFRSFSTDACGSYQSLSLSSLCGPRVVYQTLSFLKPQRIVSGLKNCLLGSDRQNRIVFISIILPAGWGESLLPGDGCCGGSSALYKCHNEFRTMFSNRQ